MSHQAVLTWIAPSDAVASSTYNVYRASGVCPTSGLGTLVFTVLANTSALTYTDSTVAVGDSYCYYGTQLANGVESMPSNTAGGTVGPHSITIQLVLG